MFRDTFAVELLLAGVPLDQVFSDRGVSRRWRIGRRDRAAGKLGDQKSAAHWLRPSPRTLQCDVGAQPAGKLSERKIIRRVEAGDEIARCTGMGRDSSAVNDEEGVARGESRPRGLWHRPSEFEAWRNHQNRPQAKQ